MRNFLLHFQAIKITGKEVSTFQMTINSFKININISRKL